MIKSNVSIIVAISKNLVIGNNGQLIWNLPTDLKRFKEITSNNIVIMGRKTWESIPEKYRPLPNRENIVLSKNENYTIDGVKVKHSLSDALSDISESDSDKEIFIIGGSEIYKEAFPYANKLYLTKIMEEVEGDVYLEGFDEEEWLLKSFEGPIKEDEYNYVFINYDRLWKN